jgi:hypothetical protein
MGIPFYSARGLTQTLEYIQQAADLKRDINGNLVNLSLTQFQKYKSKVTCKDQRTPSIDGIWPGQVIVVSCAKELAYPVGGSPQRAVVSGSSYTEQGTVFYRPQLTMMVVAYNDSFDEWAGDVHWELELEEV